MISGQKWARHLQLEGKVEGKEGAGAWKEGIRKMERHRCFFFSWCCGVFLVIAVPLENPD